MNSHETPQELETVAKKLRDAGCIALAYDEKSLEVACNLILYVHTNNSDKTSQVLRETSRVTIEGEIVNFWPEFDPWGVTMFTRRSPLYIDEFVADVWGVEAVSLEEGLNGVIDLIQS